MKLGLKLWSINENYIESALSLYERGAFSYIELFAVPGSVSYIEQWESLDIPFILHAPHSLAGFNPAVADRESANFALLPELDTYRKALHPEFIIFHPGVEGSIDETIRQFNKIRGEFPEIHTLSIVENKPCIGLTGTTCVGSLPQEITRIQDETGMGFCLDIGHAVCAANTSRTPSHNFLCDFIRLQPAMYHLSDGEGNAELDSHLNYGAGNYDLGAILQLLPTDARITIETEKASQSNLDDFVKDVEYITEIIQFFTH